MPTQGSERNWHHDLRARGRPRGRADGLVLAAVAALSTLPYVGRLGFYSDDRDFLATLELNDDRSFGGLYRVLADVHLLDKRPVQAVTQVALYQAFHTTPLGYHVFSALLLVATTVAFWLVLRELGLPRLVAVAVPAVFAVLSMASTVRFWFAAFGYGITLLLFLVSAFADLRAIRQPGWIDWRWKVVAWLALIACGLAYEVALPLLGGLVVVLAVLSRRRARSLLPLVGNVVLLAGLLAFKAATFADESGPTSVLHNARKVAEAVLYEYGTFGAGLPQAAWWGLGEVGAAELAATVAIAVLAGWWLRRIAVRDGVPPPRTWLWVVVAGLGATAVALTIYVVDYRIGGTTTGGGNRTRAGASLGMAMTLVGPPAASARSCAGPTGPRRRCSPPSRPCRSSSPWGSPSPGCGRTGVRTRSWRRCPRSRTPRSSSTGPARSRVPPSSSTRTTTSRAGCRWSATTRPSRPTWCVTTWRWRTGGSSCTTTTPTSPTSPALVLVRPGEAPVPLTTEASLQRAFEASPNRASCPEASGGGAVPLLPLDRLRN